MFEIQGTNRMFSLVGRDTDGNVEVVPHLCCIRKHIEPKHKEYKKFQDRLNWDSFAFVSSPQMPAQQADVLSHIKIWCHPFRNPSERFSRMDDTFELMPESDFVDDAFVRKSDIRPKYDFIYLTINDRSGLENKGLSEFVECLPILCGEFGMTGIVVVYFPPTGRLQKLKYLSKSKRLIIKKYQDNLRFVWGWQEPGAMSMLSASCRFGFFPNRVDCSPRVISECLLRNRPILVNEKIWGGWHYVNENTGAFFNPDNADSLRTAISIMKESGFYPSDYYRSKYGFVKSSARLARFLGERFEQVKKYSHVYFSPYKKILRRMSID